MLPSAPRSTRMARIIYALTSQGRGHSSRVTAMAEERSAGSLLWLWLIVAIPLTIALLAAAALCALALAWGVAVSLRAVLRRPAPDPRGGADIAGVAVDRRLTIDRVTGWIGRRLGRWRRHRPARSSRRKSQLKRKTPATSMVAMAEA